MKKFLTMLISIACVVVFAVSLTACGVNYGGNFTEVTEQEKIALIMEDLENALEEDFDQWNGIRMTMDYNMSMSMLGTSASYEVKGTAYYRQTGDESFEMSMDMKAKVLGENMDMKAYVKDNIMYINEKVADETLKFKMPLGESGEDSSSMLIEMGNPSLVLEAFSDLEEDFKIFVTSESGARNIKIIGAEETGTTIIFALSKDSKIKGIKVEMNSTSEGESITGSFVFEPYSKNIKFPGDLDSYEDYDTAYFE